MIAIPALSADPPSATTSSSKFYHPSRGEATTDLWTPRKVVCVVLEHDDMDKLLDSQAITVDMGKLFPELGQLSVMFCHHDNKEEAIRAFKASFQLYSIEGKPI